MGACRSSSQIIESLEDEVKTLKKQKENLQQENQTLSRKLAELYLQSFRQGNGQNDLNTQIRQDQYNPIESNKAQLLKELLLAKQNGKSLQDNYLFQQYLQEQYNQQARF